MDWNDFNNTATDAILEADRLDDLLGDLGCSLRPRFSGGSVYRGPCPVHEGRRPNCELYTNGEVLRINWKCWSRGCHRDFKESLLGFVRGVLSAQAGKKVSTTKAVEYLKKFIGNMPAGMPRRKEPIPEPPAKLLNVTREKARQRLVIPSPYFVERGFSPAVLDKMDVGYSSKLTRHVVPIYDDAGQVCIGFTARSPFSQCERCEAYHDLNEPCPSFKGKQSAKWFNNDGFPRSSTLYNLAGARGSDAPFVLVVEGPGDVWRCIEAGVPAVAIFGNDLLVKQAEKLATLGKEIILALDNDEPGQKGAMDALQRLWKLGVRATTWSPPDTHHDIGEMNAQEVLDWLEERRSRKEPWEDDQDGLNSPRPDNHPVYYSL